MSVTIRGAWARPGLPAERSACRAHSGLRGQGERGAHGLAGREREHPRVRPAGGREIEGVGDVADRLGAEERLAGRRVDHQGPERAARRRAGAGRRARATRRRPGRPSRRRRCRAPPGRRRAPAPDPGPAPAPRRRSAGSRRRSARARSTRAVSVVSGGPREVGVPAQARGHGRVALVRERQLELEARRGHGDPLRRPDTPTATRPARGDARGQPPPGPRSTTVHGRLEAVAVDRVAILGTVRRQADRARAEREAPVADPVRPGDQREARHRPRVAPREGQRRTRGGGAPTAGPVASDQKRAIAPPTSGARTTPSGPLRSVIGSMPAEDTGSPAVPASRLAVC